MWHCRNTVTSCFCKYVTWKAYKALGSIDYIDSATGLAW